MRMDNKETNMGFSKGELYVQEKISTFVGELAYENYGNEHIQNTLHSPPLVCMRRVGKCTKHIATTRPADGRTRFL